MIYSSNAKQSGVHKITFISHQIAGWTDEPEREIESVVDLLLVVRRKKSYHFNLQVKTLCGHMQYML